MLPVDLALLAIGAYGIYVSTDWLVNWTSEHPHRLHQREIILAGSAAGWTCCRTRCWHFITLARAAGNGVCVAGRRRARLHPVLHRHLCAVSTLIMPAYFQISMMILIGTTLLHFIVRGVIRPVAALRGLDSRRGLRGFSLERIAGIILWQRTSVRSNVNSETIPAD